MVTKLLLLALISGLSSGCLSSGAVITARAPDGNLATLSPQELSRLVAAIEVRLQELDEEASPLSTEDQGEACEASSDSGCSVVAAFSVGEPLPLSKVYVLEKKGDQAVVVLVDSQGGWPLSAPFTDSVIQAVKLAFSEALPGHNVTVEERAGLDLR